MRMRNGIVGLALLAAAGLAAGCSKTEAPKQEAPPAPSAPAVEDGKSLFEQKCSVCHGIDRATARAENKEKWLAIVKEMQGKKADWITDEQAGKIADYLFAAHGPK
jgi:mono/diheme cytochrome c family protein